MIAKPKIDKADFHFFLALFIPAVVEYLIGTFFGIADTLMLGNTRNSVVAIAAVAATADSVLLIEATGPAFFVGLTIAIAQKIGSGDLLYGKHLAAKYIPIVTTFGLFLSLVLYFLAPITFPYICRNPEIYDEALNYYKIILLGQVFVYFRVAVSAAYRGVGMTKICLIYNMIGGIFNVVFNYLLIFGKIGFPELGVTGAAIATDIGKAVSAVLAGYFFYFRKNPISPRGIPIFKGNIARFRDTLSFGVPSFFEDVLLRSSDILLTSLITLLPTIAYAGFKISSSVSGIMWAISAAFNVAATTMTGQAFGERNEERLKRNVRMMLTMGILCGVVCTLIIILFANPIAGLYSTEARATEIAVKCFYLSAPAIPLIICQRTFSGALRATSHAKIPMVFVASTEWGVYLLGVFIIIGIFHQESNPNAVYYVVIAQQLSLWTRALWAMLAYRRVIKKRQFNYPKEKSAE